MSSVSLLCFAALVCPGPLLVIPGQALTALHCETIVYFVTPVLVSGCFIKISIKQSQVTDTCSYKCLIPKVKAYKRDRSKQLRNQKILLTIEVGW